MSISVMLIGGATVCFVLWKLWGIIKGKNECGCSGDPCKSCDQDCSSKKKEEK